MSGAEIVVAKLAGGALFRFGVKRLVAAMTQFLESNDARLRDAWELERRDHVVRKLFWLEETVVDLGARIADLGSKIDVQADDPQLYRVWDNFVYESIREAIAERREMLAAADAGIVDPTLTIEQKARVERTLRQLDPADVRALFGFELIGNAGGHRERDEVYQLWKRMPNGDVLVSSGCLRLNPEPLAGAGGAGKPIPEVTPLGRNVLRVLRVYVRKRGPSFEIPGRPPASDEQTRQEVCTRLDAVAGLRDLLEWVRHADFVSFAAPKRGGEARLEAYFDAETLLGRVKGLVDAVDLAVAPVRVAVEQQSAHAFVKFEGPFEVLRVVADDAWARWIWT